MVSHMAKYLLSHFIGKVPPVLFYWQSTFCLVLLAKYLLSCFIGKVPPVLFYWQSTSVSFYWQSVSMTVWSVLQGILMSVWVWCVARVMSLGRSCGFCSLVSANRFEGRCTFHHPSPLYLSAAGPVPSPFDCFLANRGLKTLHIRMREHQRNAMAVAQFLSSSPYVAEVMYPGGWVEGALSSEDEHLSTMVQA